MKFHTENEIGTFDFQDSYVGELRFGAGFFYMLLDNVKVLETNSRNRDVRTMRANGLELRIMDAQVLSVIEEGYIVYDADGVLLEDVPSRTMDFAEYGELCKVLQDACVYGIKRKGEVYVLEFDGEEHEYTIQVKGSGDYEAWDRFLNLEDF